MRALMSAKYQAERSHSQYMKLLSHEKKFGKAIFPTEGGGSAGRQRRDRVRVNHHWNTFCVAQAHVLFSAPSSPMGENLLL